MKALMITRFGKLRKSLEFQERPLPELKADDVLIEVHCASINPIDYKIVKGLMRLLEKTPMPRGIGFDVSGVVKQVGAGVKAFKEGDAVFGRVGGDRPGTIAEYISVDASFLAKKPKNVSHAEAASIPLVGLTTVQAFEKAGVKAGDEILIHAGSGGIGSFAVQWAKLLGAKVATTTSTKNVVWVKALGADRVIDYKKEDYADVVSNLDFVYDSLGGKHIKKSLKLLKPGTVLINLSGPVIDKQAADDLGLKGFMKIFAALTRLPYKRLLKKRNLRYHFFLMEPNGKQLEDIASKMASEELKAIIDSTYPFPEAVDALEKLSKGHAKGKIIIDIKKEKMSIK